MGPEDFPDFVEVDWIQLTGAEELLLGELQPRAVAGAGSGPPGALLADPVFSPLWGGVSLDGRPGYSYGVLGDVDGDGDVDLVTSTGLHRRRPKALDGVVQRRAGSLCADPTDSAPRHFPSPGGPRL